MDLDITFCVQDNLQFFSFKGHLVYQYILLKGLVMQTINHGSEVLWIKFLYTNVTLQDYD